MSFFDYPEGSPSQESQNTKLMFLPDWKEPQWALLTQYTRHRKFKAGEKILKMGDVDRSLQILLSGTLQVLIQSQKGKEQVVATITSGSVVGEQAFVDGHPRSANVVASEEGELLELSFDQFQQFSARETDLGRQILLNVAQIMSARLRNSNRMLSKIL
jgi:CRP-like cAMP-binding protein